MPEGGDPRLMWANPANRARVPKNARTTPRSAIQVMDVATLLEEAQLGLTAIRRQLDR